MKANKILKNSAIAGIIAVLLVIPQIVLEFLRGADKLTGNVFIVYIIVTIIGVASYIYFVWGFKIISDRTKNKLLGISSYLLIMAILITYATTFLFQNSSGLAKILFGIGILVLFGAISIPFGIGLLRLKKEFGTLATATGVLTIISGISFVTVFLLFIGVLIFIPLAVLEIMLMFKASKKL